jgi:flagellar export protein FliJ
MKRFHFPWDNVLAFRRTQCKVEESKLEQILAERRHVESRSSELAAQLLRAENEIRASANMTGWEFAAFDVFRSHIQAERIHLSDAIREIERRRATQMQVVQQKRRDILLLEKLRQKRFAEWTTGTEREITKEAEELFLGRWRRIQ